jgi:predicted nucleic acid-binding protein
MTQSLSKYSSEQTPLYLDTSVLINLVATGRAEEILTALGRPVFVAEEVGREFLRDPRDGSDGQLALKRLVAAGALRVSKMNDAQVDRFVALVGAAFPDDLGDGESATIATAVGVGAIALDETKGARVTGQNYPKMRVYSSLDLICSTPVLAALGTAATQEGVRSAIRLGRMRVRPAWRTWVSEFTGSRPAALLVQAAPSVRLAAGKK